MNLIVRTEFTADSAIVRHSLFTHL